VRMERKRYNGRLEDLRMFNRRRFCGKQCGAMKREVQANTHRWRARRILNPQVCEECGATKDLHVHHKDKNVANNSLTNLVGLCSSCHLKLHWQEDKEYRAATIKAAASGAPMRPRYDGGSEYLVGPLPSLPKPGRKAAGG